MTQREQRQEVRASVLAFAYQLLVTRSDGGDVLQIPARSAYDALGWYAQQNPYSAVAGWYFSSDANEVQCFLEEWAIWQRVQRHVVAL